MKAPKIAFSALLIALSVASLTLYLSQQPREFRIHISPTGSGSNEGEYVTAILNCSLPEVPEKMPVLEVVRHNYTEAEAMAVARDLFNMTTPLQVSWGDWGLFVGNRTHKLYLFYEGPVHYWVPTRDWSTKPHLPKPSECKEIADRFLEEVRSYGLVPQPIQIEFRGASVQETCWDEIRGSWNVTMSAGYSLKYNGMPVTESGFAQVIMGDRGRIVEFRGMWRNVKAGRNIQISVSPEQALRNIGSHIPPSMIPSSPKLEKLIINNVELAYLVNPPFKKQDELIPVYTFKAVKMFEDGKKVKCEWLWVPATST